MPVAVENRGLRKWVLAGKPVRPGESITLTTEERAALGDLSPAALVALREGELVEREGEPAPEAKADVAPKAEKPAPARKSAPEAKAK